MQVDMRMGADDLRRRFGRSVEAAYVPGKTMFRDELCDCFGISQAEAEELCDSLESQRVIRFERSSETGPTWWIEPNPVP
jgi:hypothetical protein